MQHHAVVSVPRNHPTFRILLVGEGNLSFAYALAKKLARSQLFQRYNTSNLARSAAVLRCHVVATTFDSDADVREKYPEAIPFLAYFEAKTRVRITYQDCVNATDLSGSLRAHKVPYHLIIFNNPHIGIEDFNRHRSLLSHFFDSVLLYSRSNPTTDLPHQVVVTLCDDQSARWGLLGAAARSGYLCIAAVPMVPSEFPEYSNRRHQSDAMFPYKLMVQYYFMHHAACTSHLDSLKETLQSCATQGNRRETAGYTVDMSEWMRQQERFAASSSCGGCTPKTYLTKEDHDALSYYAAPLSPAQVGCFCIPLLHPRLAFYAATHTFAPECTSLWQGGGDRRYSPYIPLYLIPELYMIQSRALAVQGDQVPHSLRCDSDRVCLPPQLDEKVLDRPLTAKEERKRQRYLEKYGTGGRDGGDVCSGRRCRGTPPQSIDTVDLIGAPQESITRDCSVSNSEESSAQVVTGSQQLSRPTANASDTLQRDFDTHLHVTRKGEDEASGLSYCAVCDMHFGTREDFRVHLQHLSPTPLAQTSFVCCKSIAQSTPLGSVSLPMTTYRDMQLTDTLSFNTVNLDQLTETYNTSFYGEYMTHWPQYQRICLHPTTGLCMGYMLGKAEGNGEDIHGHVSAVTVAPTFRRVGLAEALMQEFERTSRLLYNAYFVDLFVRERNNVAQDMYKRLGYIVYRRVLHYYPGDGTDGLFRYADDALDMRKAMPRDKYRSKSSVIPLSKPILPEDLERW